jgi:hypothetical protein
MPQKTQRERDADARTAKLAEIAEQVKAGTLVIRKMTAKERAKYKRPGQEPSKEQPAGRRRRAPVR